MLNTLIKKTTGKIREKIILIILYLLLLGCLFLMSFVLPSYSAEQSWIPVGPGGGFLLTFAIAPSSPNVLYGGCDVYGGIYRSTDGGKNWEYMATLTELGEIIDIEVHPDSSDVVYTACGKGGSYKTTDGGRNWEQIFESKDLNYSLGIDPNNPKIVYTGLIVTSVDDYALFRSTDGGKTWPDSSFQGNPVLDICFDPDSLNTLYAGTSGGVHKSTDTGNTWTSCGPPAPSATIHTLRIVDSNHFYAGSHSDERDFGTLYKTTDGGKNWEISYSPGTTVWSLTGDPNKKDILYMAAGSNMYGKEGVYKTTNSGIDWFPVNNGLTDRMTRKIIADPVSSDILYAGTDGLGGIYKSTDGAATWIPSANGMRHTVIQSMSFDASNNLFAAVGWGTYRDIPCIFKTSDKGNSWDTLAVVPSPYYMTSIWDIVTYPGKTDHIYAGGTSHYSDTKKEPSKGLLYMSDNGGKDWKKIWTPDSIWILCLAIDPVFGNIYAGTGGGDSSRTYKIYRSTDNGGIWEPTAGWSEINNTIMDIVIDPVSPNILYAGTGGVVYKSTDYGATWIPKAIIPLAYTLLINPLSTNEIYAGSGGPYLGSGGIYKSTDSGETWGKTGLEEYAITSLAGDFGSSGIIYAGTGGVFLKTSGQGIFQSTNQGASWEPINNNLTAPFILSMIIDPNAFGSLYAGTMGGGIFKYTQTTGINNREDRVQKPSYHLSNFPNPFNAYIQITYQIPVPCRVNLDIYDINGRFVTSLIDKHKQAGHHTVKWNGRNDLGNRVTSGVYFYQFRAGDVFSQNHKIILLK
jgi:photosystem II stability/assembly factor-like uncharacterized protein